MDAAETAGGHRRELAAALQGIAEQEYAQPQRAQHEAETTEGLEGSEIGIFDGVEGLEPRRAQRGVEAVGRECFFQCRGQAVGRVGLDQEVAVAAAGGKVGGEAVFGDEQFALEEAALDQGDQAQGQRIAVFVANEYILTQTFVQDPLRRVEVADGGDYARAEITRDWFLLLVWGRVCAERENRRGR